MTEGKVEETKDGKGDGSNDSKEEGAVVGIRYGNLEWISDGWKDETF